MKPQIARAYIVLNDEDRWDALDPDPDPFLWWEANRSPNPYFQEYLERRDPTIGTRQVDDRESGKCISVGELRQNAKGARWALHEMVEEPVDFEIVQQAGEYDGLRAGFEILEQYVCGFEERV